MLFLNQWEGNTGILCEKHKDEPTFGGIFFEVHKTHLGGYISLTGVSVDDGSYALVSFGPSYNTRYGGAEIHFGACELLQYYLRPILEKPNNDPNAPRGGDSHAYYTDYYTKWYYGYGVGIYTYIYKRFFVLHGRWTYLPKLKRNYIGIGIGLHIYNPAGEE